MKYTFAYLELQKLVEQMLKKRYIEYTENKDKRGRNGTV